MRVFTAIEIPVEIKNAVLTLQRKSNSLRWIKPEQMHITLNFLGELDESIVTELVPKLENIKFETFELKLHGAGFFPSQKLARVFWIGVLLNEELQKLKSKIDNICELCNIQTERKDFKPHLTIARISQAEQKELAKFAKIYEAFNASFLCSSFTLFSSILQKEGAIHSIIKTYPADNKT